MSLSQRVVGRTGNRVDDLRRFQLESSADTGFLLPEAGRGESGDKSTFVLRQWSWGVGVKKRLGPNRPCLKTQTERASAAKGNQANHARRAMTLIELLVSAVLASLMMVALSSIVWSSARDTRQLALQSTHQFPTTQLVQQMRFDLANARGMLVDSQGMTLHGFLGSDAGTLRAILTPGRVRYELATLSGKRILMRVTTESREPVWQGCGSLRVESMDEFDPEDELLPLPESGGLPEVPSRFRITMTDVDGRILWREVIHHHDG